MKLLALSLLVLASCLCAPFACARLNHPAPTHLGAITHTIPDRVHTGKALRIATYNVHMESSEAIVNVVKNNQQLRSADILLLQEIEAHDREGMTRAGQIAAALDMSFAYAPGYGLHSGGSHGVAILSRFTLKDVEIIELPYYHVVVNSARRAALAATIEMAGQDLRIYSVHLDNRINPDNRSKQFKPVLEAAHAFTGPVVIAGDLNTSPFCWAGNLVPVPCGMQDNATEDGARRYGLKSPIADIGATSKWFAMKLDAVYIRGLVAKDSAVERSVRLSDHLPLWIDLELEG